MKQIFFILAVPFLFACADGGNGTQSAPATETCREISINGAPSEKICTQVENGYDIYQGDIVLGEHHANEKQARGALINSASQLAYYAWKSPVIPYTIDPALPNPARVAAAVQQFAQQTGIQWVARTSEPDFVTFRPQAAGNCTSYIGRIGGQQFISLVDQCTTGNVLHEMGHAVGMWHEHCRPDRDQYITIHYENMSAGAESNFAINPTASQNFGAYDLGSIMHYAYWSFSKNGQPTITTKDGGTSGFGDRTAFSAADVAAIRALFSMNGYVASVSAGAVNVVVGPNNNANDLVSSPQISFDIAAGGRIDLAGITSDWNWFVTDSAYKTAVNSIHVIGHFAPPAQMTGAPRIFASVVYETGMRGTITVPPIQVTSSYPPAINMYRSINPKLFDFFLTLGWGEGNGAGWDWTTASKAFAVYTYPFQTAASNCTAVIYRCRIVNTWRHFLSVNNCGGQTIEGPSGYACYSNEASPPPNHFTLYRIYHVGTGARLSTSAPEAIAVLQSGGWAFEGFHGIAVRNPL